MMLLSVLPHSDPLPLSAPVGLLRFLLLLTFFLHLVPMNLVLGGSLILAIARTRRKSPFAGELAAMAAPFMPVLVAAAISFGVAPLLFIQVLYGRLFFVSSVLMAWYWFSIIPVLILAYYGVYRLATRRNGVVLSWVVVLFFTLIAFTYTHNLSLMLRPEVHAEMYQASGTGFHGNFADPTFLPRFLHNLMGAIAVSGGALTLLGLCRRRIAPEFGQWALRWGSLWFAIPTILNMATGMWWLVALPRETMLRFMGQNLVATLALGLGMVFTLAALFTIALAPVAKNPQSLVLASLIGLVLTLVGMVLARDQVRQGALEASGFDMPAWQVPQWGPIALFAVMLFAALGTIVWITFILGRGKKTSGV